MDESMLTYLDDELDLTDHHANDDDDAPEPDQFPFKQVEYRSEFHVDQVYTTWQSDDDAEGRLFQSEMNCYGIFHVRVLRVSQLLCPVGSHVNAIISLLPWKGKVRTEKVLSFYGDLDEYGVCAQWDEDETPPVSMVHDYVNQESPVPSIKVDIVFSPLGMGMFELSMCTLTLSCEVLMTTPLTPRRQWFGTSGRLAGKIGTAPMIELEAMFEPVGSGAVETTEKHESSTPVVDELSRKSLSERDASEQTDDVLTKIPQDIDAIKVIEKVDDGKMFEMDSKSVEGTPIQTAITEASTTTGQPRSQPMIEGDDATSRVSLEPSPDEPPVSNFGKRRKSSLQHDDKSHMDGSVAISMTSMRRGHLLADHSRHHLLRLRTHWTPAICCVCRRSIQSGLFKVPSYRCETCNVDCCEDCQLQVDLQLPCGSDSATKAVSDSIQSKLTMDNFMNAVAPVAPLPEEESAIGPVTKHEPENPVVLPRSMENEASEPRGIGTLKLNFVRGHVFATPVSSVADTEELLKSQKRPLRSGDYYARVSWSESDRTPRTRTIQNSGRPLFESEELQFIVPHYGATFRLELIDAATDMVVGAGILLTQSLLQQQRDEIVEGSAPFLSLLSRPLIFRGKRPLLVELRSGMTAVADFFKPTNGIASTGSKGGRTGEISGCLEVLVGLEENLDSLFGQKPYVCPPRPPDELNMTKFQVHIARISGIISDIRRGIQLYQYCISWTDPVLTTGSFIICLRLCALFDPAYLGSIPIFLLLVLMLYLAIARRRGTIKGRFMRKAVENHRKSEKVAVDYSLHRPMGILKITVERGRNLVSPETGLAGNVGCHLFWDPNVGRQSRDDGWRYEIGKTDFLYTASPKWDRMHENEAAKRLKRLLPGQNDMLSQIGEQVEGTGSKDLEFPVLQPFKTNSDKVPSLEPWTRSTAAVLVVVSFSDILSVLPGSEHNLGEILIPIETIVERKETCGWYPLRKHGPMDLYQTAAASDTQLSADKDNRPEIFIRVNWVPPAEVGFTSSEIHKETSLAVQEELLRLEAISRQQKTSLLGSSMGAINTVRSISDTILVIQNTLGLVVDTIESIRNAFNFTDPFKSSMIGASLLVLWLFFSLVPTRTIVFVAVVFAVSFTVRYGGYMKDVLISRRNDKPTEVWSKPTKSSKQEESDASPFTAWILNAFRGLPTDEDLERAYFWESHRSGVREMEKLANEKRNARLQRLWKAQWYSSVQVLAPRANSLDFELQPAFALIHGHRFMWWKTADAFDVGETPVGVIFLSGHAGIATPSPRELKALESDDFGRVVVIFGRGTTNQMRLTMVAPTEILKMNLEVAVEAALSMKID